MIDEPIPSLFADIILTSPGFMERTIFENWFLVIIRAHEQLHGDINGDRELLSSMFIRYMQADPYLAGLPIEQQNEITEKCLDLGVWLTTKEEEQE